MSESGSYPPPPGGHRRTGPAGRPGGQDHFGTDGQGAWPGYDDDELDAKLRKFNTRPERTGRRHRFLPWLASVTLMLAIVGFTVAAIATYYFTVDLPQSAGLRLPERAASITVFSVDGETMGRRGSSHGGIVLFDEMPAHLVQAIVAIEDQRFFDHFGIDIQGLVRAFYVNYKAGRIVQGGSTLTQQLAKNLFLKPDRTIRRKIQEVILALRLEASFSKQEILEQYLNRVYFGAGTFGIEAASERYFDRSARSVTLGQAAMLAGLVKAPSRYAPTSNRDRAVRRAQLVLDNMHSEGFITQEDKFVAEQVLRLPHARAEQHELAPYILDWVAETIPQFIDNPSGDLFVETSLDLVLQQGVQEAAERIIATEGEAKKAGQTSVVLMTNDGLVRAMVGGLDYEVSQFNRATKGLRQPGSTFKFFVYLAGLQAGMSPWTVRVDSPVRIGNWSPHNYSNRYSGSMTIDRALTKSVNTIAVKVAREVGIEKVRDLAHSLGIVQDLPKNATLALGTGEVTLVELTGAFAALPNAGRKAPASAIIRILSGDGQVLYQRPETQPAILGDSQVLDMNLMLSHVVEKGTGRRAQLDGHEAAGKTGTTQSYRDAWFIGYTGHYTAGVWVGNDDNSSMERVTGGNLPAMIWKDVMTLAHTGLEPVELAKSEPRVETYRPPARQNAPLTASQPLAQGAQPAVVPPRTSGWGAFGQQRQGTVQGPRQGNRNATGNRSRTRVFFGRNARQRQPQ